MFGKLFGRTAGVATHVQVIPSLKYYRQVLVARAQWENLAAAPLLTYRGVDIHLLGVPEINYPTTNCLAPFPGPLVARLDEAPGRVTDLGRGFDTYVSDISPLHQHMFPVYRRMFDDAKFTFTDDVEENLELVRRQAALDRSVYKRMKFPEPWIACLVDSGCIPRLDGLQMVGRQNPPLSPEEAESGLALPSPDRIRYCGLTPLEEKHRVLILANLPPEQKNKLPFFKNTGDRKATDPSDELRSLYRSLDLDREDVNFQFTKFIASRLQSILFGPNSLRTYHGIIEKNMGASKEYKIAALKQRCKVDRFIESLIDSCDELVTKQEAKVVAGEQPKKLRILGILDRNLVHLIRRSWDLAVDDYRKMA